MNTPTTTTTPGKSKAAETAGSVPTFTTTETVEKPPERAPLGVPNDATSPRLPLYPFYAQRPTTMVPTDAERRYAESQGINLPGSYVHVDEIQSRYYAGDESMFAGMSEEFVWELQQALIETDLVKDDELGLRKGVWDEQTKDAFSHVLDYANRSGLDWQGALTALQKSGMELRGQKDAAAAAKKAASGPKFTPRLSNPDDIRKVMKQSAYNLLGGQFIDDGQLDAMVQGYQGAELGSQRAQFNAAVAGGGTSTDAPQPSTFAEKRIEELDQTGVEATKFAGYAQVLEKLIGGAATNG